MRLNRRSFITLLLGGLLGHLAPFAGAARNGRRRERSLDSAVARARRRTGGRVLSAETRLQQGREVHVIRILTDDGKVRRIREDAHTGRPVERDRRRR